MHMWVLNIGPNFVDMISGDFFKDKTLNRDMDYLLSSSVWKDIGKEMENSTKCVPAYFGRTMRNIAKYKGSFKSEEWARFLLHYAVVLLEGKLPDRLIQKFSRIAKAMQMAVESLYLTQDDIIEIKRACIEFYLFWEK